MDRKNFKSTTNQQGLQRAKTVILGENCEQQTNKGLSTCCVTMKKENCFENGSTISVPTLRLSFNF